MIAHVAAIGLPGQEKVWRLTGEIFRKELLHEKFLYGLMRLHAQEEAERRLRPSIVRP